MIKRHYQPVCKVVQLKPENLSAVWELVGSYNRELRITYSPNLGDNGGIILRVHSRPDGKFLFKCYEGDYITYSPTTSFVVVCESDFDSNYKPANVYECKIESVKFSPDVLNHDLVKSSYFTNILDDWVEENELRFMEIVKGFETLVMGGRGGRTSELGYVDKKASTYYIRIRPFNRMFKELGWKGKSIASKLLSAGVFEDSDTSRKGQHKKRMGGEVARFYVYKRTE